MSFTSELAGPTAPHRPTRGPNWADVYLAATARAVSYCGDFVAATALALNLQTRGDSGYGVAGIMIASVLPVAVLGSFGGRIADRVDSRRLLVGIGLAQAVVCAGLAFTGTPVAMIALVALVSAGLAVTQPTLSALIPEMVGPADLGRAAAIGQTASAVGMLLGPVLGGVLVGAFGVRIPLLVDAATFLALAGAGRLLRTRRPTVPTPTRAAATTATPSSVPPAAPAPGPEPTGSPETLAGQANPGWRLRDDRLLVTLIAALSAVIAAVTAVNVAEIFFVRETLGASAAVYGLVSAGWMAGVLFGAWPWGRVRGDDRRLVGVELVLLGVISAVVLASGTAAAALWLLPLYLVGGLANAGLNVLSGVVVARRAPKAVRGRVFGVLSASSNAANLIGYAAGGLLLPLLAPRTIMIGTGVCGLLVALAFRSVLVTRAARTPAEPAIGAPVG